MTGRAIIERALQEIGVQAAGETVSAADEDLALKTLQRLINATGAERLLIFQVLRTAQTLTSGTRDYTIGSGGTINIVRPVWVERAGFILDSTASDPLEIPIDVLSEQRWAEIRLKTFDSGTVQAIYYDPGFTPTATNRGTISTYPTVNQSNTQIVLYTPVAVIGFVNPTTEYVYPPGYEAAYHFRLAYELQRPFGAPSDPELKAQMVEAEARVKRSNYRPVELVIDPALTGHGRGTRRSEFESGWQA